jgi:hypothetical protein
MFGCEARQRIDPLAGTAHERAVPSESLGEDYEGDLATQRHVAGAVDIGHAAVNRTRSTTT